MVRVAYWVISGVGTSVPYDVYLWDSVTGASTRLTAGDAQEIYPATDGTRVAWQRSSVGGGASGTFTLVTRPLAGGPAVALSTTAWKFLLRDGVLAWTESRGPASGALVVSTGGTTTTLAANASLIANAEGHVIYSVGLKLYSWSAATGVSTLRADDSAAERAFVSNGALFFRIQRSVYRVAL